ncbi:MAG: hypothetical protein ACOZCL_17895 [Bacillota bacterium]
MLVAVLDQNGQVITDNSDVIQLFPVNSSLPILMQKNKAITAQAVNRIASFINLYLPFVGEGYTLMAQNISVPSMNPVNSDTFSVKAPDDYNAEVEVVVAPEPGVTVPGLEGSTLLVWNELAVSGAAGSVNGAGTFNFKNLVAASGYNASIISTDGNILAEANNVTLAPNKITTVKLVPKRIRIRGPARKPSGRCNSHTDEAGS